MSTFYGNDIPACIRRAAKAAKPTKRKPEWTDKQLKVMCAEFRKGMISKMSSRGKCAMISWALEGFLSFAVGLKTSVHESQVGRGNHLYLVMPDGRVIDCTADQFGKIYPKIYIGKPLKIHNGKPFEAKI